MKIKPVPHLDKSLREKPKLLSLDEKAMQEEFLAKKAAS
jgi:hypothetical protein